jgi:protein SCO1/2
MKNIRYILWGFVAFAFIAFIALALPPKNNDTTADTMPIAGFNRGAHFNLIDHHGAPFNSATELSEGEFGLIFFGFTHCPVICPTELQKFAVIIDGLPKDIADKIHPLFITIDPERDTVEALKAYVPLFHDKIVGLTGSVEDIHNVLNAWKIFFTKVDDPQFTEYTMDHSTYAYLVDHDMSIKALFRMKNTPAQIMDHIKKIVQ